LGALKAAPRCFSHSRSHQSSAQKMHKCFDARQFFAPIIPAARNYFTLYPQQARDQRAPVPLFLSLGLKELFRTHYESCFKKN
jgi:hypothetical protein